MATDDESVKNTQIQELIEFGKQIISLQSLEPIAQSISFLNSTKDLKFEIRDVMKLAIIGWLIGRKRQVDGDKFLEVDPIIYMNAAHIIACSHGIDEDNEANFIRFVETTSIVNK